MTRGRSPRNSSDVRSNNSLWNDYDNGRQNRQNPRNRNRNYNLSAKEAQIIDTVRLNQ